MRMSPLSTVGFSLAIFVLLDCQVSSAPKEVTPRGSADKHNVADLRPSTRWPPLAQATERPPGLYTFITRAGSGRANPESHDDVSLSYAAWNAHDESNQRLTARGGSLRLAVRSRKISAPYSVTISVCGARSSAPGATE